MCLLWSSNIRELLGRNFLMICTISVLAATMLSSCGEDENTPVDQEHSPITFAFIQQEEQSSTRAGSPLASNFTVWGYKSFVDAPTQKVFQGYKVTYVEGTGGSAADNTHGYSYVDEEHNQSIKYWDAFARQYNFWGYTGGTYTEATNTLVISDLVQSTIEPNASSIKNKLFTGLYHREPVTNQVVQLQFKRPYAKVRVLFYTNQKLTDKAFDNIKISDITFGPESPKQIVTSGSLKVTYPQIGVGPEAYSTTFATSADNLPFEGEVVLDHTHGTASNNAVTAVPTGGLEYYYVVPNDNASPFTLSARIDNEDEAAVVPAEFMEWRPNFVYTYIFKVSGGKYMEFYDVQIDPWTYGGGQEEKWKNW